MRKFSDLNLPKLLFNGINELGFETLTPIQDEAFSAILSGRDVVGIAQTGTGKTLAYMLPILHELKFSQEIAPRVLVLVPTRELVVQIVENIKLYSKYKTVRVVGVFGEVNIKNNAAELAQGADIVVATPGRLFDLIVSRALKPKNINKLVIDEVDVMLDLGFRTQINNILELLPERRQNIMFSATMTEEVQALITQSFFNPITVEIAPSGAPLQNISQSSYYVPNFYTKINLLVHLLSNKEEFKKVLVFVSTKKMADKLFEEMNELVTYPIGVIHSNKSQNLRLNTVEKFENGEWRILIATDILARGIDFEKLSHVINFDTPEFPENYIHRIGRSGRAGENGSSILFFTEKEETYKIAIEELMGIEIAEIDFPEEVRHNSKLLDDERPKPRVKHLRKKPVEIENKGFHEKSEKNKKVNLGSSYYRKLEGYKKPIRRGDKTQNLKKKKR